MNHLTQKYRQLTFLTLNDHQHDSNDEPKSHGERLSFKLPNLYEDYCEKSALDTAYLCA